MNRLSRECIVTEKLDGTNGLIFIDEDCKNIFAGSRNRWLTKEADNFGFAAWVELWREELIAGLGPGYHYGEWWGQGIQRGYGLKEKRFSLFDALRWGKGGTGEVNLPICCYVVPILYTGIFWGFDLAELMQELLEHGSYAAPGYMRPEGVIIRHNIGRLNFKKTFEDDEFGKDKWDSTYKEKGKKNA